MLSIDVGTSKVCVVEGNYRGGNVELTAFSEIEYKGEVVSNGNITDRAALSFLINEIIKTNNMKSKKAVISVKSTNIISRSFKFPNIKFQNLKLLVFNEMSRIVGEDGNFVIDFVINGLSEDKMVEVTAYAVKKEIVESYFLLLRELKLKPVALEVHANAISKLFFSTEINGRTHKEDNIIVADIGFSSLSLHGFTNGVCKFNRVDVSMVGDFVSEVGAFLRSDMTAKEMEKLDFINGSDNSSVNEACKYFVFRLSEELQKYIQYIIMNSESKQISQIYLCGGIASAKGLDTVLGDALKIPVEVLTSVGRVKNTKNFPLSKACGAAGALIRSK